jgi:hypothetical protein
MRRLLTLLEAIQARVRRFGAGDFLRPLDPGALHWRGALREVAGGYPGLCDAR